VLDLHRRRGSNLLAVFKEKGKSTACRAAELPGCRAVRLGGFSEFEQQSGRAHVVFPVLSGLGNLGNGEESLGVPKSIVRPCVRCLVVFRNQGEFASARR
jgi:hypothetical protein